MRVDNFQLGTGQMSFWSNAGGTSAPVETMRTQGRIFVGSVWQHGAQVNGADVTNGGPFQSVTTAAGTTNAWRWMENSSRAVFTALGGAAVAGIGKTEGQGASQMGLIGAIMNNSALQAGAYGAYLDAVKGHSGAGNTVSAEMDCANIPGPSPRGGATPYDSFSGKGMVGVLRLAGGSDQSIWGRSYASDFAAIVEQNGGVFHAGIVIRHNALLREGTPDDKTIGPNTGYGRAISLANEHGLSFYARYPESADGTQREALRFLSKFDDSSRHQTYRMIAEDVGLSYHDTSSGKGFTLDPGNGTSVPQLRVRSNNTNEDFYIVPKGTGKLRVGYAAGAGTIASTSSINRYLEFTDGTGATIRLWGSLVP